MRKKQAYPLRQLNVLLNTHNLFVIVSGFVMKHMVWDLTTKTSLVTWDADLSIISDI